MVAEDTQDPRRECVFGTETGGADVTPDPRPDGVLSSFILWPSCSEFVNGCIDHARNGIMKRGARDGLLEREGR